MSGPGFRVLLAAGFAPSAVVGTAVPSGFAPDAALRLLIEERWTQARLAQPRLFDGPLCRLEDWRVEDGVLRCAFSPLSYRYFLGTNVADPGLPAACRANPLGTSALVESADGGLLLGRRSQHVLLYPGRLHPLGGCVEPDECADPVGACLREVREELVLGETPLRGAQAMGLIEDLALAQPELVCRVGVPLPGADLLRLLDPEEHGSGRLVPADRAGIEAALADPDLTPIALGSLLLWGGGRFGAAWRARAGAMLGLTP